MHDLKQFRPTLYLVLAFGMAIFCLAVENPGLLFLSLMVLLIHYTLVRKDRFRPIPRLVANIVTLSALAYTFVAIRTSSSPIVTIGQFLVFLQLVKLFELRANRDYVQLLILSLLLMVAGAISTASLLVGVLVIIYLFISLYCCLLFHLKVENDAALSAQTLPVEKLNAATVKQDQRYLPRSMKKLAALVSAVAIIMACFVFLFFPRGTGAGMFGQLQFRPGQALTGFSEDASIGAITRIQQNTETVANVQVTRADGSVLEGTRTIYLRGRTFDFYNRRLQKWERAPLRERDLSTTPGVSTDLLRSDEIPIAGESIHYHISLRPTGTRTLFSPSNPFRYMPGREMGKLRYVRGDQTLATHAEVMQRLDYDLDARQLSPDDDLLTARYFNNRPPQIAKSTELTSAREQEAIQISPRIAEYARRPEVSGDEVDPDLASKRPYTADLTDLDERIAGNIQRHLLHTFKYTLDLGALGFKNDSNRDPLEQFLYEWKAGHCEYFADSMVLLCQSLGIEARLVHGFKCDEYDSAMGHYYIVRQSHAHAWVEVRTQHGWKRFDPTSGNEVNPSESTSTWQSIKHFFNFLDYKWATSVIAYDGDRRDNLIANIDQKLVTTVVNSRYSPREMSNRLSRWWDRFTDSIGRWLDGRGGWSMADSVQMLVMVGVVIFIALHVRRLGARVRMRRRARKIGLTSLPGAEQIRLARQLGFYARLMTLLEKHRITRPRHLTPQEFCDWLTFLPNQAFISIQSLTKAFYAIRFGRQELSPEEQKELDNTVDELEPLFTTPLTVR